MWKLDPIGNFATHTDGTITQIFIREDGFCVEKNGEPEKRGETIRTFQKLADAKKFLAKCVKKWNRK